MADHENLLALDDANFSESIKSGYVFVDFWAEWCHPCRVTSPIVEQLSEEWKGKVKFAKVNVDDNPLTAQQFGIVSIPKFLLFKDGEQVAEITGAYPKPVFVKFLEEHAV
jgi:thioredoxin 1